MKKPVSLLLAILLCLALSAPSLAAAPDPDAAAAGAYASYLSQIAADSIPAEPWMGLGRTETLKSVALVDMDLDGVPELVYLTKEAVGPAEMLGCNIILNIAAISSGAAVPLCSAKISSGGGTTPHWWAVYQLQGKPGLYVSGGKSHALGSEQAYYAFSLAEGAVAQETLRESVTDLPGEEASYEQNGVAISKAAYEQRRRAMSEPVETLYFDTKSDNSLQAGFPYDEALAYLNRIAAQSPSVGVKVNGAAVQWTDARPFIDENSRTMVPLRAVAEALGLNVRWDGERREAIFDDGAKTLYFPIGSSVARTGDGGAVQMDTAAVIVSDRTYAPVRYLAEYFGFSVGWDGAAKMVLISAGNR